MAGGIARRIEDHGTCCALCDEICQELNIVITAFTEACCAGTEASLALTLPNAGLIIIRPPIDWDAIPFPSGWPKNRGCKSTGLAALTGSLWYDTGCGSLAPSQRRSTCGGCALVARSSPGAITAPPSRI